MANESTGRETPHAVTKVAKVFGQNPNTAAAHATNLTVANVYANDLVDYAIVNVTNDVNSPRMFVGKYRKGSTYVHVSTAMIG